MSLLSSSVAVGGIITILAWSWSSALVVESVVVVVNVGGGGGKWRWEWRTCYVGGVHVIIVGRGGGDCLICRCDIALPWLHLIIAPRWH